MVGLVAFQIIPDAIDSESIVDKDSFQLGILQEVPTDSEALNAVQRREERTWILA